MEGGPLHTLEGLRGDHYTLWRDGGGTTRHFRGIGEGPLHTSEGLGRDHYTLQRDKGGTTTHFGGMGEGPPDTSEGWRGATTHFGGIGEGPSDTLEGSEHSPFKLRDKKGFVLYLLSVCLKLPGCS